MSAARGFDFGTSPHGLPASLRQQDQETCPAERSSPLADGFGVSLFQFATSMGLLKSQALRLARKGRIAGAYQSLPSRKWFVSPCGELLNPLQPRRTWRDRFNGGQP